MSRRRLVFAGLQRSFLVYIPERLPDRVPDKPKP